MTKVTFHSKVNVRTIASQWLEDEGEARWYTSAELTAMRKRQFNLALAAVNVGPQERAVLRDVYAVECPRSKKERQTRMQYCKEAVMREQDRQFSEKEGTVMDDIMIRKASRRISCISKAEARRRASQLQKHISQDFVPTTTLELGNTPPNPRRKQVAEEPSTTTILVDAAPSTSLRRTRRVICLRNKPMRSLGDQRSNKLFV